MGVGKRLKQANLNTKIVAVWPKGCDVLNGFFIPHKIQATAIGILPKFIDKSIIDSVEDITFEEAEELRRYLAKKESLFVGISSGANIAVAIRISKSLNNSQNIVTIAPDSGRSYL